jgi:hypothetical protein
MNTPASLWGFLGGIPGYREVVLLVVVALALYGRSGLQIARRGQTFGLPPWLSPVRRTSPSAARRTQQAPPETTRRSLRGDRVFWFLVILASTAVAAWIDTRTLIVGAPKAP